MNNFFAGMASAHADATDTIGSFAEHHGLGIMGGSAGWLWMSIGLVFWILVFALVVLGVVALTKFVLGNNKRGGENKKEKVYVCDECGYEYEDKEWAMKCQAWCREHKSCNLEIIKHGRKN